MVLNVKIQARQFSKWINRVTRLVERNISYANRRSSKHLAQGYRERMSKGLDARGVPMKAVSDATMGMPVRVASDKRKRRAVNPNQGKPLVATGATARSIKEKYISRHENIIHSTTGRGNIILANNAGPSRRAGFGKNRRQKPLRDPMQVTEKQIAIVEDEILKQLDRAFR